MGNPCKEVEIKDILQIYITGAISSEKRSAVERHLKECEDCASEISILRVMAAEHVPEPGEGFWETMPQAIYKKIKAEDATKKRRIGMSEIWEFISGSRLVWVPATAVLLAVIALFSLTKVLPSNKVRDVSFEEPILYDQTAGADIQTLEEDGLNKLASWADGKLSVIPLDEASAFTNGHEEIYDEVWEMDPQQMERLDHLLDKMKKEV